MGHRATERVCMRWIMIVGVLVAVIFLRACVDGWDRQSILKAGVSVKEQRNALLMFEKEIECEGHSVCWNATVDGKGREDPVNAVNQCTWALARQDEVMVPDVFPASIKARLGQFKQRLRMDTVSSLVQAQEEVASQAAPVKYGVSVSFKKHPTCEAYAIIDKINRLYDVQKLMKGQYINCEAIQ